MGSKSKRLIRAMAIATGLVLLPSPLVAAASDGTGAGATFTLGHAERASGQERALTDQRAPQLAVLSDPSGELALADTSLAQATDPSIRALVAATPTYVDLSWAAVPGANSYVVVRNGRVLATTTETTFRDSDVNSGAIIDYQITTTNPVSDTAGRLWGLTAHVPAAGATSSSQMRSEAAVVAPAVSYSTSAVQWQTFIPTAYVNGPSVSGLCDYWGSGYKYGGDNRGYLASGYPYRTSEQGTINWNSGASVTSYVRTGTSSVYTSGGTLVATRQASTSAMSVTRLSGSTSTAVDLRFVMHASNPFCGQVAGAIDGAMTIHVTRTGAYSITSGNFRQMPNHEIYIQNGSAWKTIVRVDGLSTACLFGEAACPLYTLTGLYGSY